jgi:hypothetical protein
MCALIFKKRSDYKNGSALGVNVCQQFPFPKGIVGKAILSNDIVR